MAPMILGIVGGVIALLIGMIGFTLGQLGSGASGAGLLKLLSIGIPVAALVGASMSKSSPKAGGILMLGSALGLVLVIGINMFSLLPGIPLAIAGAMALAQAPSGKQAPVSHEKAGV